MQKIIIDLLEDGLDSREVGNIVVEAIRVRRFYALTHPWQDMVEQRMQSILQGRDPVASMPLGMAERI